MSRDTSVADRTAAIDSAFEQAPAAQLPATVQQVMIDERPQGAIAVNVKRNEQLIFQKIKTIATAAGDDFFYSWNTKNKDGTKGAVEGPSVKAANAVARLFGNCSVKVRVFDMGANWIFYAQFYDMETGYVLERPFQQRKGQNVGGGMDKDRAADIVFQIGTSKAVRNVVCNALSEFTDYAFAVAKEQLVEKIGKNLAKFHAQVMNRLVELKVETKRVELVRSKTFDKWVAADLAKIIAEIQSVNDGMIHQDDVWPPLGAEAGAPKPQPEDFQDKTHVDDNAQTSTAGREGEAARGAQGQAAPATGKDAPKQEGQPAATQSAQAEKPDLSTKHDETAKTETAQADPQDGKTGEIPLGPEELAANAMEAGEAIVQRGIDNLVNLASVEEVDKHGPSLVAVLAEIENLDPEDAAVLRGRWNTATLERKRDLGKKGKARR